MREILHHSRSYNSCICIVTNMTSSLVLLFTSMYCFFSAQDTWTMFLQYFLCKRWTNLWAQKIVSFSSLARQECTFGDICGELNWAFWCTVRYPRWRAVQQLPEDLYNEADCIQLPHWNLLQLQLCRSVRQFLPGRCLKTWKGARWVPWCWEWQDVRMELWTATAVNLWE